MNKDRIEIAKEFGVTDLSQLSKGQRIHIRKLLAGVGQEKVQDQFTAGATHQTLAQRLEEDTQNRIAKAEAKRAGMMTDDDRLNQRALERTRELAEQERKKKETEKDPHERSNVRLSELTLNITNYEDGILAVIDESQYHNWWIEAAFLKYKVGMTTKKEALNDLNGHIRTGDDEPINVIGIRDMVLSRVEIAMWESEYPSL